MGPYRKEYQYFISIHAPHARSDHAQLSSILNYAMISIHAPHARSDSRLDICGPAHANFNPRSSCEERLLG